VLAGNQSETFLRCILQVGAAAAIFTGCLYCTGFFTLPDLRSFAAALFERHA